MKTGKELARAGCPYLGRTYSEMDCQKFVETALAEIGITLDLKGSNAWFRKMTWTGSPEDCKKKFGCIPDGAFLFIHAFDGGEEQRGYHDGKGNASHIGIFTNLTEQQMMDIAVAAGNTKALNYGFGSGAIHSSSSRGHVATSKFNGKTISGGWNMIGLWNQIDYGDKINSILNGGSDPEPAPSPDPEPQPEPEEEYAVAWAESGSTVNMRKNKSTSAKLVNRISIGDAVKVLKHDSEWSKVAYTDRVGAVWYGWVMNDFLKFDSEPTPEPGTESYIVCIPFTDREAAYNLLSEYPNGWIQDGVG